MSTQSLTLSRRFVLVLLAVAAVAHVAAQSAAQRVVEKAAELAAADEFSGAILIAHEGKVVVRQAFGSADRERRIAATPETRFRLGSMNKMFTAVAVLQFVDAGLIGLDDPLSKFLPDYPNKDVASRVTVRHLLTHTGGTGDIFPEYVERRELLREHGDFVRLFGARPPTHEPGAREQYSNYGYVLLGVIIERLSGRSYYDHVALKVYKPAGMTHTDSPAGNGSRDGDAIGYVKQGASWSPNTATLPWRGSAAGGGYSTVDDLLRFAVALQSGALISRKTFEMATTPHREGGAYGLGFQIAGSGATRAVGHSGGAPGITGDLRILPGSGHVFVALANQGAGTASALSREFRQRLGEGR